MFSAGIDGYGVPPYVIISHANIEYDHTSLLVENFRSNRASGLIHLTGTRP